MGRLKVFVYLVGMLAMVSSFPTPSVAVEDVKIGVILPLSGPSAGLGESSKNAVEFATAEVNAGGGIKSLGGAKLKLIYGDSTGKPEVGQTMAEQLIHKDNVALIMGAWQSGVTLPSSAVAERNKVPYLVYTSVSEEITSRGFKYIFRPGVKATRDTGLSVEGTYAIGEKKGMPPKTFAIVYENTEWGQGNFELLKGLIAERKGKIVFQEGYAASASDLNPMVMKIKAAKPDVLMCLSYLADSILLAKTVEKQQVDLMATVNGGGGAADSSYLPAAGDAANYEFTISNFDVGLLRVKQWAIPINEAFKAKYGVDFDSTSADGYGLIWLLKDVLERAGSTDREKIRDAFVKTNITSGKALFLPHKKIEFDQTGQNPYADEVYLQAYKGKFHIVYPFEFADPDFKAVWPKPKWSERK